MSLRHGKNTDQLIQEDEGQDEEIVEFLVREEESVVSEPAISRSAIRE